RLHQRIAAEGIDKTYAPGEIKQIAQQTLQQVCHLSRAGRLAAGIRARQDFKASVIEVLKGIDAGRSCRTMLDRLTHAVMTLNRHSFVETGNRISDSAKKMTGDAVAQALDELSREDPAIAARIQAQALSPDSPLRAILAGIERLPPDATMERQQRIVGTIKDISEAIVEGLGAKLGPKTLTTEKDVNLLRDRATSSASVQL